MSTPEAPATGMVTGQEDDSNNANLQTTAASTSSVNKSKDGPGGRKGTGTEYTRVEISYLAKLISEAKGCETWNDATKKFNARFAGKTVKGTVLKREERSVRALRGF